jgi:hypothetical protein
MAVSINSWINIQFVALVVNYATFKNMFDYYIKDICMNCIGKFLGKF